MQNGATGSEDSQPGTPVVPGIPVPCPQCPAISFCPTLQRLSAETTSPGTAMCPRRHRLNPRGAAAAPPHIPARGALRTAAPSPPRREPRSPGAPAAAPGRGKPGGRGGRAGTDGAESGGFRRAPGRLVQLEAFCSFLFENWAAAYRARKTSSWKPQSRREKRWGF